MKILQIIPAPEWLRMKWLSPNDSNDEPFYDYAACLALIEDGNGEQRIVAVSSEDCGDLWNGVFTALSGDKSCRIIVTTVNPPSGKDDRC